MTHPALLRTAQRVATICALLAAAVGALALVGRLLGAEALAQYVDGAGPMKANSAVCTVVLGAALVLHARERRRAVVVVAATTVLALAFATLFQDLAHRSLGIDQLLAADRSGQAGSPGRMAPATALAFASLAGALLLDEVTLFGRRQANILATAAAALAALALLGHIGGAVHVGEVLAATRMAVPTIAAILLLAAGTFAARPRTTSMRLLTSPDAGGVLARRLLPVAVGVPVVTDIVRDLLRRAGVIEEATSTWLLAFAILVAFVTVVVRLARRLDESDAERRASEHRLRVSEALSRSVTDLAADAIVVADGHGLILRFNAGAEQLFGWSAAEAVGRPVTMLMPERYRGDHEAAIGHFNQTGESTLTGRTLELHGLTRHHREIDLELSLTTFAVGGERYATAIMRDVTPRKRHEALLRLQAERLGQVVGAQAAIAGNSGELDDVLHAVALQAAEIVAADGAVVELPDGDELVYRAAVGSAAAQQALRVSVEGSLSGLALRSRETMNCTDARTDPRVDRAICEQRGVRSMVCVPLSHEDAVVGILEVVSATPQAFSEPDERTLELLAGLAGAAVRRAQSERRLAAHHAVARALAEAGTLDSGLQAALRGVGEELGWHVGFVWLVPEGGDAAACAATWHDARVAARPLLDACADAAIPAGQGAVGRAWGTCRPSATDRLPAQAAEDPGDHRAAAGVSAGLVSAACVPIVARGEALGALEVWSRDRRPHGSDIVELLELLATQVGQFVQRKRAEERVAAHARHLEAVIDLAEEISRAKDPAQVRPTLCRAVCAMTGSDQASLLEPDGHGNLVVTAQAGDMFPEGFVLESAGDSIAVDVLIDGRGRYVADVSEPLTRAHEVGVRVGLRSAHLEPVIRDGAVVGVLTIGSLRMRPEDPEGVGALVRLLAAETAGALERADLVAALNASARTDQLTGVPNRRAWDEELPRELARALRASVPLCVAMLDLDHFKAYNDTHGHPAGDRLLRAAAAGWAERLRTTDVIARYGGEEFAVLLPGCPPEAAAGLLADLQRALPPGVTCSIGLASWDGDEEPEALIARADAALYRAKRDGRDRVVAAV